VSYLDDLAEMRAKQNGQDKEHLPADKKYGWWEPCDDPDDEYVEKQRAGSLLSHAQSLDAAQREVHEQNMWSAQLYSNRELAAFDWGSGQMVKASMAPISRTGENITVRVVETLVSQIGKNRPKPKPIARGATFSLRQQIRRLDKFLYGEFQRNRLYALTKMAFRDACVFGFGCLKVTCEGEEDNARVGYERVFPDEILIDQMEIVACGKIRHFYRRRVLPIEVIASTYNISEENLSKLTDESGSFTYLDYRPIGRGWAVVVEGYQLASGNSPGRWMVATNNIVLDEGEWEHEWLPYVFFHWQVPISGFYSPSVVEQVLPYQIRLNEINEVIRDAQDLMGRPRILVAEGSRVNPLEIDNVIGRFIKYTGIKPEAITWPAISAELYNERDRLVRTCMEQFGVSQMAATAQAPAAARFDSSAAFREFNNIQDDRLSDPAQRFEELHLELARTTISVIGASGLKPKTTWYSGWKQSKAEEINWDEIDLDENSFTMTMEATSIFSMSPASARDELEKQLAMGLMSPEQYRLELSNMDTESQYSLQAAAAEDLNRVQELLETGEFENPIPEQDLVAGVTQMTLALLNLGKYKDFPEDIKLNFVNWITLARELAERGTDDSGTLPDDPAAGGAVPPDPMGGMMGAGPMMGGPASVPVPEAAGLAAVGPGPMPGL
jgi:hypothetical protein